MAFHREAFGCQLLHVPRAVVHIKHLVAAGAVEMVVMVVVGLLVARILTRQIHGGEHAVVHQGFDVPVDRGDAQAGH